MPRAITFAGRARCSAPMKNTTRWRSRAEIAASLGDLLPQPPTPQVLAFINGEVQREADSDAFEILHTPLVIRLAGPYAASCPIASASVAARACRAEVVALHTCDVLLLTGRPARFPGVQALLRHPQPLPASRILAARGLPHPQLVPVQQTRPHRQPGNHRRGGLHASLLAIDLRLESFYFNVGDFQPYPPFATCALDGNNMLADDNVYYRDTIWIVPTSRSTLAGSFQLRGPPRLGLPPTGQRTLAGLAALYADHHRRPAGARLAGDAVITLRLAITASAEQGAKASGSRRRCC
ncbi:virulence factor SrfB [Serratia ureilytica]